MAKRFTDSEKYKKLFIRNIPAAYKIFWDYLYHDCSFAGIWQVDFEVAQIRVGKDAPINEQEALKLFNKDEERIRVLDDGSKWLIMPFIDFQYGKLNPKNRVHNSVLEELSKYQISPLQAPYIGAKDKEKDKEKDKDMDKDTDSTPPPSPLMGTQEEVNNALNTLNRVSVLNTVGTAKDNIGLDLANQFQNITKSPMNLGTIKSYIMPYLKEGVPPKVIQDFLNDSAQTTPTVKIWELLDACKKHYYINRSKLLAEESTKRDEQRRKNPCPECDGTGWKKVDDNGSKKCPDCKGSGINPSVLVKRN